MSTDPWHLVGWALLVLSVVLPTVGVAFAFLSFRNRRRAWAEFQRRRQESEDRINDVRKDLRSGVRGASRFELPPR